MVASANGQSKNLLFGWLKTIRKHWALVVASTLVVAGVVLVWSKAQPKVYRSTSMLQIDPQVSQPLGVKNDDVLNMGAGTYWDARDYYETQYKVIASDRALGSVVRDLGLQNNKDFLKPRDPSSPATIDEATGILRSRVTVDPVRNSRLVYVHVDDTDPKRAKQISDAIDQAYIDQNLRTAIVATSDAVDWLNGQVGTLKQELEKDENALYDFKQRNDLPSTSINEASNMLRIEMQELDTALTHTRTRRSELEARHAELSKVSSDDPDKLPASELLASQFLQSLRTQYQEAVKERAALVGEGKGEGHPLVKRSDEKISVTKAALLGEIRNIQGAVERDLAIIARQEGSESTLFEATRKRAVDLNMKEIEYHRLDRSRDENEKLYALLLERMKESELARRMKVNNIRVVDEATEPRIQIRPRVGVNLAVALLVGLALGLAAAWLREQLDSSLKTPDDVEQQLGVTFLGLLPELGDDDPSAGHGRRKRRRRGKTAERPGAAGPVELIVHDRPLSGIAEAARSIRTNLMFMNPDRPHRTLLVTSAAPSEGKTTVACSIAVALAQGGQRVCLVDCDLRRPRLHRIFDRSGDAGVTNVLVGTATIDDVARPTVVDNLWAVPAGPVPPNPADMLHSERFKQFIKDLGERFDRVIIDSPPLVAVTDPAIISTLVDGTVFVVRAFKTSKHLSGQGLRALRDVDSRVVGAVLNAVNLGRQEYSYYYHYYYYKREGYRSTPASGDDATADASPPN
jgi:succinoglycan biosynthesis transport protein ExoP